MSATLPNKTHTATRNACKLCAPLGASLVFKGIRGAIPLLHGSQGCATYIRRYLISHFKEPVDIACSNFGEHTAIFGGGANLKIALENIGLQYRPELVGVATTCLSETIGDDVAMFIKEYRQGRDPASLPSIVHAPTPSYSGTHMDGFHTAVQACVAALAQNRTATNKDFGVNLFPGMVSPADLRYLQEVLSDFALSAMMLPDYSRTLDGSLWTEYRKIPPGGTPVASIVNAGNSRSSIQFGRILSAGKTGAGRLLEERFSMPCQQLGLPIGIRETDRFFAVLEDLTGRKTPERHVEERGRLLDSLVDGHKVVSGLKAVVYGEEDLVVGLAAFLAEIGIQPVLCASGGRSGHLREQLAIVCAEPRYAPVAVMEGADFVDIEEAARPFGPDLLLGNSKGYSLARRLEVPLVRAGFPIHDRIGGSRLLHLGYRGAQQLFDRIVNTSMEKRQSASAVGYSYM